MDTINREKLLKAIRDFKTVKKELISSYQEGYIGKNVYKVTLEDGTPLLVISSTLRDVPSSKVTLYTFFPI